MVATIAIPHHDSISVLKDVLKQRVKYKSFYNKISSDLNDSYNFYISQDGNPEVIEPLDLSFYTKDKLEADSRKKTLINLYFPEDDKIPFDILFSMRRDHGLLYCPLCGQAGAPPTLDHYLPKDQFPEFSILLLNLVPICFDCQGIKGTNYLSDIGSKKFIHPYFDQINEYLYKINFKPPYDSPTYSISTNQNLDSVQLSLAEEHFRSIELDIRIKRFCIPQYVNLLKMAKRCRNPKKNTLVRTLRSSLDSAEDRAINCWEAIFYRSVLSNRDLLRYLIKGALPINM